MLLVVQSSLVMLASWVGAATLDHAASAFNSRLDPQASRNHSTTPHVNFVHSPLFFVPHLISQRKFLAQVAGLPGVYVDADESDAKLAVPASNQLKELAEQFYLGGMTTNIKLT